MYAREIAHLVIFLYIYLTNSLSLFLYEKIYRIREFVTNLNRYFFILSTVILINCICTTVFKFY